jgi:hypothetical protein
MPFGAGFVVAFVVLPAFLGCDVEDDVLAVVLSGFGFCVLGRPNIAVTRGNLWLLHTGQNFPGSVFRPAHPNDAKKEQSVHTPVDTHEKSKIQDHAGHSADMKTLPRNRIEQEAPRKGGYQQWQPSISHAVRPLGSAEPVEKGKVEKITNGA